MQMIRDPRAGRSAEIHAEVVAFGMIDRSKRRLNALRKAAQGDENLMPFIFDAVKSYATLGEICDAMRETFGTYEEIAIT